MWNLPKPDLQKSIDDLEEIANHSVSLKSEHLSEIESLYRLYDAQNGMVTKEQHDRIDENARKGLRDAYNKTSKNAIHAPIKNAIITGIDKCPMCSVGNARTLDHFLEKSEYKALSMMRQNLVPMCRDCNSNREYNDLKPEDFIHAYYDLLPTVAQWLKVKITYSSGAISTSFYVDHSVLSDPILFNKASKTLDGIEFNKTVGMQIHSFLTSTLAGPISSDVALRTLIRDKAISHMRKPSFGLNHWKTVILLELASNPTLTRAQLQIYI